MTFYFSEYKRLALTTPLTPERTDPMATGRTRARRRAPTKDTARIAAIAACAAHLRDLKRAHRQPPPDVEVAKEPVPRRLSPEPANSYCTSPAELCAELIR